MSEEGRGGVNILPRRARGPDLVSREIGPKVWRALSPDVELFIRDPRGQAEALVGGAAQHCYSRWLRDHHLAAVEYDMGSNVQESLDECHAD